MHEHRQKRQGNAKSDDRCEDAGEHRHEDRRIGLGGEPRPNPDEHHRHDVLQDEHSYDGGSDALPPLAERAEERQHRGGGGHTGRAGEEQAPLGREAEGMGQGERHRTDDQQMSRADHDPGTERRPELAQGELDPDREEQEGKSEFGHELRLLGVVDQAEPRRADECPRQQIAGHLRDTHHAGGNGAASSRHH